MRVIDYDKLVKFINNLCDHADKKLKAGVKIHINPYQLRNLFERPEMLNHVHEIPDDVLKED